MSNDCKNYLRAKARRTAGGGESQEIHRRHRPSDERVNLWVIPHSPERSLTWKRMA